MKRTLLAVVALVAIVAGGTTLSFAEDKTQKAPAAAQPAKKRSKGVKKASGCMPDGSCCGHAACAHEHAANQPAGAATGGCPCMKNKQKPAS